MICAASIIPDYNKPSLCVLCSSPMQSFATAQAGQWAWVLLRIGKRSLTDATLTCVCMPNGLSTMMNGHGWKQELGSRAGVDRRSTVLSGAEAKLPESLAIRYTVEHLNRIRYSCQWARLAPASVYGQRDGFFSGQEREGLIFSRFAWEMNKTNLRVIPCRSAQENPSHAESGRVACPNRSIYPPAIGAAFSGLG